MAYTTKQPTVTRRDEGTGSERDTYEHPAFGRITVSKPQGGGTELFGSALKHRSYISITVETARMDRALNNDWIHGGKVVAEFNMSEAQWAHFVASAGNGGGTPITFRYKPEDGYRLEDVPGIESIETMKQTFRREVEETCREQLEYAKALVKELTELVAAGKANKGQLQSALGKIRMIAERLPGTMGFIQEQFAETMEKTVEAGKTELEAYLYNLAQRTGLDVLRNQSVQMLEEKDAK